MRWANWIAGAAWLAGFWSAGPAAAGMIEVVSAGAEYAAAHPQARRRPTSYSGVRPTGDFAATMDQVFGPGRWRQTSGYRTQAQEDALRARGAGTVAPGRTSLHSLGEPAAPGAYDAVVPSMPLTQAAERLRRAGAFARVLAEGAHGAEGAHRHVELVSNGAQRAVGNAWD